MNFYFKYLEGFCEFTQEIQEITIKVFGLSPDGFPNRKQTQTLYSCNNIHCKFNNINLCNIYQQFHSN